MGEKPNFYAILPANVRYDERLRPNAKLLYAEITALSGKDGFCVAQNDYFSKLFGISKKTVSELVAQLSEHGYVKVEVLRDGRGQVTGRRIRLPEAVWEAQTPPPKNRDTSPENPGDPPPKNREVLKGLSLQDITNTPIAPTRGGGIWRDYAGKDGELLQALRDFEQMRRQRKKPMSDRAKKMLLNALEKHSGGSRARKLEMLETSILHCWDTVYPPKESAAPSNGAEELEEW